MTRLLYSIYIYIYILRQSINGDDYLSGAALTDKTQFKKSTEVKYGPVVLIFSIMYPEIARSQV